jgi:DNA-binding FrmR family transcriptional regulator
MAAKAGPDARAAHLARLSRIEGQVRGIRRMIEQGRACDEVLPQLRSATRALCRVQDLVLRHHLQRCVLESFASESPEQRERKAEEIFLMLSRYREP